MHQTATKPSPNQKRLTNIEKLVRSIGRKAEKVLSERDALAVDRDFWRGRAQAAEAKVGDAEQRAEAAEAKVAAVVAALGFDDATAIMSDYPAEPPVEDEAPAPAPVSSDDGQPFAPAFDAEFLEQEERAQRQFILRHLNYSAPDAIDYEGLFEDARGLDLAMSQERAYRILDYLFARYTDAMSSNDSLACRIGDFDSPDDFDWDDAIERADATLAGGEAMPTYKGWDDDIEPTKPVRKAALAARKAQPKAVTHGDLTDDDRAILKALTGEWQTVLELHKSAKAHGFTKGNQTVRNMMARGLELHPGVMTRFFPLAWKWADDEAPVTKTKLYGRMSSAERLKRDRLLLQALGDDEPKSYEDWGLEWEAMGGEPIHRFESISGEFRDLEPHRSRLAKIVDIEKVRVTGKGPGNPHYRVKGDIFDALAKLK